MKLNYKILAFVFIAGILFLPVQRASAQLDTLAVEWDTAGDGIPVLNALHDAIIADTLADGSHPANRVYKLRRGGYYWNPDVIDNVGFHLRIVGETPTPTQGPAILQNVQDEGGNVSSRMLGGQSSITLKNLYIMGQDNLGDQGTRYQPCQIDASNSRFIFENCIFERSNFSIVAFTSSNNDIFFRNNVFRNLVSVPITQQWEGRGVSIWADQDTVVFENNTFFLCHMTAIQIESGAAKYLLVNHNTFVNIGRNINTGNWFREAYWTNNLVYNGFWHSEGHADVTADGRDPRATTSGLFSIGALPSKYGPEIGRKIVIANTSAFLDQTFIDYYADSLKVQPFINPVTREDFINVYDAMVIQDTVWADPGLATTTPEIYPDMIAAIDSLRSGKDGDPYFWMIPEFQGERCHTCRSWPLPEDFSYTNQQLLTAGTDGLPLGDLRWFPNKLADYYANRDAYLATVYNIGPQPPAFEVRDQVEAEGGSLGGDATVEPFSGFSYYQMDGGGFIEWTFDLTTGGQYDINVWTHMRNNPQRGQHTFINNVEIHDSAHGWNELIYDNAAGVTNGMVIDDWTWVRWTQADLNEAGALTFLTGENVIKISSSWGYQNFAGIDLLEPGTDNVVKSLRAPDVTAHEIVLPVGEGAVWTPSGFNSVALGSNGSVSWNINVPTDGRYRLRIFYQNVSGPQTGQIQVNGTTVPINFDSNTDSTGLDLLTDGFDVTAGSKTFTLTGSGAKIDYVQLLEEVTTAVESRPELPEGFSLSQNYPNPFNPTTNINFSLGKASAVKLTVYNVLGQKVATVIDSHMNPGSYTVQFDGSNLASGVYFYRFEAGDLRLHKRMLLLK